MDFHYLQRNVTPPPSSKLISCIASEEQIPLLDQIIVKPDILTAGLRVRLARIHHLTCSPPILIRRPDHVYFVLEDKSEPNEGFYVVHTGLRLVWLTKANENV